MGTAIPQARGALAWVVLSGILLILQAGVLVVEHGRHAQAVKAAQEDYDRQPTGFVVDSDPSGAEVRLAVPDSQDVSLGRTPLVVRIQESSSGRTRVALRRAGYSGEWVLPPHGTNRGRAVQSVPLVPTLPLLSALVLVYPWGTAALLSLCAAAWMRKRAGRLVADLEDATEEVAYTDEGGRVGDYRLLRLLGEGGMAEVFLGQRMTQAGAGGQAPLVAVKVMRDEICSDAEFRKRIDREVAIARSLEHPHIARLLDSGEDQGRLYMVMEYVKGSNLRARMDALGSSPVSPREAVSLMLPVVSAVAYAHGKGVVHRDLKPENILLTEAGAPKVTDFGMARAEESETLTATGMFLGTPAYMAPEQVSNPRTTPRADIYSLGCILYELLAGRLPFTGGFQEIVMQRLSEDPPPLRTFRDTVPEALERVVMQMLHLDADERPESCEEVSKALSALLPRLPSR